MKSFGPATQQLKRRLGRIVATDEGALREASFDSAKIPRRPDAVIKVRQEADIGVVLELAKQHRIPGTTRGRGTPLTGAATPMRGGWVIDMLGLKTITIDGESG